MVSQHNVAVRAVDQGLRDAGSNPHCALEGHWLHNWAIDFLCRGFWEREERKAENQRGGGSWLMGGKERRKQKRGQATGFSGQRKRKYWRTGMPLKSLKVPCLFVSICVPIKEKQESREGKIGFVRILATEHST